MNIYYCFYRSTGEFAGSGITEYDTPEVGSTTVPCPEYEEDGPIPIWNGTNWEIPSGLGQLSEQSPDTDLEY